MKKTRMEKGITLVALIITIVVLLILASVVISSITNDGILGHAQNAADKFNSSQEQENILLNEYMNILNNQLGSGTNGNTTGYEEVALATAITDAMYSRTANSQTSDIYGNIIKIPAGFKILVDSTTGYTGTTDIAVEKGIVITDGTNQFVYVPVGSIKTASETKNITLARYTFNVTLTSDESAIADTSTGEIVGKYTSATEAIEDPMIEAEGLDVDIVEGTIEGIDDQGKGYAKNISDFISKASSGYYIGRYEARYTDTALACNATDPVLVGPNQIQATEFCKTMMYTDKPFEMDLVNSFAWDTAIAFIQSFEDSDYSKKTSLNTSFLETGTVGTDNEDKVCNIYDMASNCSEWTTETFGISGAPCTLRGGNYYDSCFCVSIRNVGDPTGSNFDFVISFRPLLYL